MKKITNIKIYSALVMIMIIAMNGLAETSTASTATAIPIDNTIPEPGMVLAIAGLLMLIKVVRK